MEHINDSPVSPALKSEFKLFAFAIIVTFSSLMMGYYLVITSVIGEPITNYNQLPQNLISYYLSIATSTFPLGGLLGSYIFKRVLEGIGSENTFMRICDIGIIIACLANSYTLNIHFFIVLRFLIGVLFGFSSILIPTYLTSISPTHLTGRIGSLNQIFITIGIALTYYLNFVVDQYAHSEMKNFLWKAIVVLPVPICLIRIVALKYFNFDCLERHIRNKEYKKLNAFIKQFYIQGTFHINDLIKAKASSKPQQTLEIPSTLASSHEEKVEEKELKKKKSNGYRKRVIIALVFCLVNQLCGINLIIFYANRIFYEISGSSQQSLVMSFYLGIFQVIVTILSGITIDKFGRKFLTIVGTLFIIVGLFGSFAAQKHLIGGPMVGCISIFVHIGGFSLSLGPITMIYISEILEDLRPYMILLWVETVLVAVSMGWVQNFGIDRAFLIFGLITCGCLGYIWKDMIESKNKNRKQLEQQYQLAAAKELRYEELGLQSSISMQQQEKRELNS